MDLKTGDRVAAESESTERPPRFGVVEEVLDPKPSPASASAGMMDTRASTRRRQGRSGASPAVNAAITFLNVASTFRRFAHAPTPSRPGRGRAGGSAAVTVAAAETPPRRAHSVVRRGGSSSRVPTPSLSAYSCRHWWGLGRSGETPAPRGLSESPVRRLARQDSRIRAPSRSRVMTVGRTA